MELSGLKMGEEGQPALSLKSEVGSAAWSTKSNYHFVVYCINHAELAIRSGSPHRCLQSYRLFEKCYTDAVSAFQDYFEFVWSPQEKDGADGTTVCEDTTWVESLPSCRIVLLPTVFRCPAKQDGLTAYVIVLEKLVYKYQSHAIQGFYKDWRRLFTAYVGLICSDLSNRWCNWLRLVVRKKGERKLVFRKLQKRFWKEYLIFSDASVTSIECFTSKLSSLNLKRTSANKCDLRFGIWLDMKNGILILANSVYSAVQDGAHSSFTKTTDCIDIQTATPREIVKKCLLFINFAILECFTKQID